MFVLENRPKHSVFHGIFHGHQGHKLTGIYLEYTLDKIKKNQIWHIVLFDPQTYPEKLHYRVNCIQGANNIQLIWKQIIDINKLQYSKCTMKHQEL